MSDREVEASTVRRPSRRLKSATGIAYPRAYVIFRGTVLFIGRLFMKAEMHHQERIPNGLKWRPGSYPRNKPFHRISDNAFIIAPNHGRVYDIPFVGLFHRPLVWIAKPAFCRPRPLGAMNQRMGAVPVLRPSIDGDLNRKGNSAKKYASVRSSSLMPNEALGVAQAALVNRGVSVVMFPEGTRSGKSTVTQARYGTARLAVISDAPILPLGIYGCAKGDVAIRRGLLRRRVIIGVVGTMIDPKDFADYGSMRDIEAAMMEAWRRQVNELRDEAYAILVRKYQ